MKRIIISLALLCTLLTLNAQDCVFQYKGKSLENDATIKILAREDPLWGTMVCDTNPADSGDNGLFLKNNTNKELSCSATITILSNSMDAENIQWCMGQDCMSINTTSKSKEFKLAASSKIMTKFDCEPTKEGEMSTKLEVRIDGKTYTVNIIFINKTIILFKTNSFKYTGRSPQLQYEVIEGYEAYPTSTFSLEKNVGTYSTSITFSIFHSENILEVEVFYQYTIHPETIHAKVLSSNRFYGEANPQFMTSYYGFVEGEDESVILDNGIYYTSATTTSDAGKYVVKQSGATAQNYIFEYEDGVLEVNKADLQVSLKNVERIYGMNNPTFELSYIGLKNEEKAPEWTMRPTITTEATSRSDIGSYAITASGGIMKNYVTEEITPGALTITPAPLNITANNISILYFSTTPTLTYTYQGFMGTDNEEVLTSKPVIQTTATKTSPVGNYPIEVSGADAKNYVINYVNGTLSINKRKLTVIANDYTRSYGEENPILEFQYDGFVNDEDENVLITRPQVTTTATKMSDVGRYEIIVGNGTAENYEFSYVNGWLTIEKAYQQLTWEQDFNEIQQFDQLELTAEASSGLPVSYSIQGDNICSITLIGQKQYLDCFGSGEAVIVAVQEGNLNYWQTTKLYKSITIIPTAVRDLFDRLNGVQAIYDANGRKLSKMQRGVNVFLMSDGTKRKVIVK